MGNFKSIFFHKSGSANKQQTYQWFSHSIDYPISIRFLRSQGVDVRNILKCSLKEALEVSYEGILNSVVIFKEHLQVCSIKNSKLKIIFEIVSKRCNITQKAKYIL